MKKRLFVLTYIAIILLSFFKILVTYRELSTVKSLDDLSKSWTLTVDDKKITTDFKYNSINDTGYNKYVTLEKTFTLPRNYSNDSIYLKLSKVSSYYKVFVNDVCLGQNGSPPPNYFNGWQKTKFFLIPATIINYNGENTIRLEYYASYESGFWTSPTILDSSNIDRIIKFDTIVNYSLYIAIITLLVFISLLFIFLYFNGIRETFLLFFSALCFFLSIYYQNFIITYSTFGYLNYQKIIFSSLMVTGIVLPCFVKSFFLIQCRKWDKHLVLVQILILIITLFIHDSRFYMVNIKYLTNFILLINICRCCYICVVSLKHKLSNSLVMSFSFLLLIIFVIHDAIDYLSNSLTPEHVTYEYSIVLIPIILLNTTFALSNRIIDMSTSIKKYSSKLENLNAELTMSIEKSNELYYKTIRDDLTQIYTRDYIKQQYDSIVQNITPSNQYAMFFIDIDNFRSFNNKYGHDTGDFILKSFTEKVSDILGPLDIFARHSGDEFLILLYNTDGTRYLKVVNYIIKSLNNCTFSYKYKLYKITCSIGIKLLSNSNLNFEEAVKEADANMYYSKQNGKNTYSIAE